MLSVGIDVVDIERIAGTLGRFGERFLRRVYTPAEVAYCRGRLPELAARFAAKEAVSKALGTGLVGISWREMEILGDRRGKPVVTLHGRALLRARELGLDQWAVSLTHTDAQAVAMVVATASPLAG
ncbi:MAG: holo-ACP synthase [Anaerolineae bacterium]|jgi:holo-[acyl-carrier protein] synthase